MWALVKKALRSFFGAHFVLYHIVIVILYVLTWIQINQIIEKFDHTTLFKGALENSKKYSSTNN